MNSYRAEATALILSEIEKRSNRAALTVESNVRDITPVDTGRLRNSVTHDADETGFIVGTNVHYAPYVELGTRYQSPQPYLRTGLIRSIPELQRIYGGGE